MGSSRHVLQGQVDGAYPLPVTVSPSPDLDHLAEAFAASLADLTPVAERRGNYVDAPVVARTYISD